mmetsp:Transcript_104712/g.335541  ORF Transcript_104712/g.335541 Transcript_104712/m.335541 type:complete len:207 (+) Transcript_104712:331-951(+)
MVSSCPARVSEGRGPKPSGTCTSPAGCQVPPEARYSDTYCGACLSTIATRGSVEASLASTTAAATSSVPTSTGRGAFSDFRQGQTPFAEAPRPGHSRRSPAAVTSCKPLLVQPAPAIRPNAPRPSKENGCARTSSSSWPMCTEAPTPRAVKAKTTGARPSSSGPPQTRCRGSKSDGQDTCLTLAPGAMKLGCGGAGRDAILSPGAV